MYKTYTGAKRNEICFPIGGIGTGCIGLDGTGRLRDWEIFNRPAKGSINGFSHFGIKAESDDSIVDARVMNADLLGSYMGRYTEKPEYAGYGFGPSRYLLSGVPHFRDSKFDGKFPGARVRFIDDTFPGRVNLRAFNPFIPSDPDASGIPAAFFTAEVRNTTDMALTYTFELSVNNPSTRNHVHRALEAGQFKGIELADDLNDAEHPEYGSLVFGAVTDTDVQRQLYWYRGSWFDNLSIFWQDFTAFGTLRERDYTEPYKGEDVATVAVRFRLEAGQVWQQRFIIAWYYPNCYNYWSKPGEYDPGVPEQRSWKNYYAKLFSGAGDVAAQASARWDKLFETTWRFSETLYSSSLPKEAMEAVGADLAVLKSPTVFRLSDGQFYGFEGCQSVVGSCEGSCTHVWNYAMALPFLFPTLERSMRELDYEYNQRPDGGMAFRLQLPLGKARSSFRPCVDGQMGGVIKTYREWKLCGDDAWLRALWPRVKKSLEFAWAPTNADKWDPDKSGVITGRQHHTLDMELFGPNSWLESFYLGALKAGAEMADAMGDTAAADLYRQLLQRGREYADTQLFNGEYYHQRVDIRDRAVLERFDTPDGGDAVSTYWSEEAGQIKYQIAEGCGIDQVLGQWMCEIAGLGQILDGAQVASALQSIYRYNHKKSLRGHFNPCRIYGLNDESGTVICEWPAGREKPVVPVTYAEECMHGFEYQVATHMIRCGMEAQGLELVRSIRSRYDGEKRNPWNEMECGSNYARSMASYALLLVYSGFTFDMRRQRMGLLPRSMGKFFWSLDGAWGYAVCREQRAELLVLYGELTLREWVLPNCEGVKEVRLAGSKLPFEVRDGAAALSEPVTLRPGMRLIARY